MKLLKQCQELRFLQKGFFLCNTHLVAYIFVFLNVGTNLPSKVEDKVNEHTQAICLKLLICKVPRWPTFYHYVTALLSF
jgi:hypothetical protein